MMQRPALAIAIDMGETGDALLAGGQQLLAGKFRRGMQIERRRLAIRRQRLGGESMQMRLVARRHLQRRRVDLDEVVAREETAQRRLDGVAAKKERPPVRMDAAGPPGDALLLVGSIDAFFLRPPGLGGGYFR